MKGGVNGSTLFPSRARDGTLGGSLLIPDFSRAGGELIAVVGRGLVI
jgi:hypothetical protein